MNKKEILDKMKSDRSAPPVRWAIHVLESLAETEVKRLVDILSEYMEYKPEPSEDLKVLK